MPVQEVFMSVASLMAGIESRREFRQSLEEQKWMPWSMLAHTKGINR